MKARVHVLTALGDTFVRIRANQQRHEVRKADRDYRVGDFIILHEVTSHDGHLRSTMSSPLNLKITHITPPGTAGLPSPLIVFSFEGARVPDKYILIQPK